LHVPPPLVCYSSAFSPLKVSSFLTALTLYTPLFSVSRVSPWLTCSVQLPTFGFPHTLSFSLSLASFLNQLWLMFPYWLKSAAGRSNLPWAFSILACSS
jgi:hypothetical protein